MYRFLFKPKWIAFHVLVIATIVAMVNLGFWQKHRLEDRREFNSEVRDRSKEPVVPIDDVVADDTDPGDVQWRTVTVTGTYLPDEQVLIVNRSQAGAAGVNVVTPMELADGRLVLINRGFVPDTIDVPMPAEGVLTVTGRLRETQERSLGGLTEGAGDLTELFRVDIPRLAQQLPGPVLAVYVDLLAAEPDQGRPPIPLPDPELGEGSHLSYMFQWWIFSVCVAVGWVLAVRHSIRQRRRDLSGLAAAGSAGDRAGDLAGDLAVSEPGERTRQDSPSPAGDAATTAPG